MLVNRYTTERILVTCLQQKPSRSFYIIFKIHTLKDTIEIFGYNIQNVKQNVSTKMLVKGK